MGPHQFVMSRETIYLINNDGLVAACGGTAPSEVRRNKSMNIATESEFDTQLVRGIQTALRKARELGYPVEIMDITASVSTGYITSGGDLTLFVNAESDELIHYERGQ